MQHEAPAMDLPQVRARLAPSDTRADTLPRPSLPHSPEAKERSEEMTRWTTEPYAYQQGALDRILVRDESGYQVAIVSADEDARLIAAAPALLEALEALLIEYMGRVGSTYEENAEFREEVEKIRPNAFKARDQARNAIALAKGEGGASVER